MIGWIIIAFTIGGRYVYIFHIRYLQAFRKVTSFRRGNKTERDLVYKLLKYGIPHQTIFHDLYLKTYDHKYAQIDIVVATKVGLIVFEVKNYGGWIFGTGNQRSWTQVLNYGKEKHRFYNPILQNKNHITQLKKKLGERQIPFFSVIVFYGNCVLKDIDYIPKDTYLAKSTKVFIVLKEILRNHKSTSYIDKREVVSILKKAVKNGENRNIRTQHIQNIKNALGKDRIFH